MGIDYTNSTVVITINDLNDNSPMFSAAHYFANVSEEIPSIFLDLQEDIIVTDADQTVRYMSSTDSLHVAGHLLILCLSILFSNIA